MLIEKDRVAETTATTGTGTITGAGAVSGDYQDLTAIGNANTCAYTLLSGGGGWETGSGTVTISGGTRTMSRDIVDDGSSGPGVKISLSGTSRVFCNLTGRAIAWPFDPTGVPTSANTGFGTWRNQGGASIADYADGIRMTCPGGAGDNLRLRTKAAPATPYTCIATFGHEATFQNYQQCFLGWDDGTRLHLITLVAQTTPEMDMQVIRYNSVTSFNSTDISLPGRRPPLTFFIRNDGTTMSWGEYRWGNPNPVTHFSLAVASSFVTNRNTICWGGGRANVTGTSTFYASLLMYRELPF